MEEVIKAESSNRPTACQSSRTQEPITDLEIIEQWGKTNGGTASDIKKQCPKLKSKTLAEISRLCALLVAEGRLHTTNIQVRNSRYMGRSLERTAQYMSHARGTARLG